MSNPKQLRPVLDAAISRSLRRSQSQLSYGVLVILCCDGAIADVAESMEKICQASYVPLSVIIAGIGDGEFPDLSAMKLDNAALSSPSGNAYMRDVARFVQYSQYDNSAEEFVGKAAEKIPNQLVQYYLSNGIFPKEIENQQEGEKESRAARKEAKSATSSGDVTALTDNRTTVNYGRYLMDSDDEDGGSPLVHSGRDIKATPVSTPEAKSRLSTGSLGADSGKESASDYGKFLLDSMASLDLDEDGINLS
eukprot:CAMPEP_0183320008 /NCGR_PEP_ID=MMETSP0160_2-20130417/65152_1 /TAXON_ID=2839 ORGANISM="Odontella Sinensis, Strain Grunow 1884" /NCGR_SAMPLE_ID=MMETSP0160_2 /ASSEMBLY_ACC=CAM_ASM_000250 /LENGTH=250 /DNA_ID=CAMNT_0025486611 /DNA_START=15 /DNA_END=765 /DNA_ORIENTATION=-